MQTLEPRYTITREHVALTAERPVCAQRLTLADDRPVLPHDHDYFEITLVLEGTAWHYTADAEETVTAGTAVVVPPGPAHGYDSVQGLAVANVYYLTEWLFDDLRLLWEEEGLTRLFVVPALFSRGAGAPLFSFELDAGTLEACLREVDDIVAQGEGTAPPSRLVLKACLLKLMGRLGRAWLAGRPEPALPAFHPKVWAALNRIEQALQGGKPTGTESVAADLGITPDHLGRIFREATGETLTRYYQRRRLQQAQRLLLNPARSITEVAHACGYADAAHLCHQFRQFLSTTPTAYRERYTGGRRAT